MATTGEPGATRWLLTDNLNTVRDVIDSSGAVLNHLAYSSFGILTSQTNPAHQPLILWTGRPYDTATGLQNNWHRWYDPAVGKWISEDPIGFAGGDANVSRYVGNSSTLLTDPTGLDPEYGTREWFRWFYTRDIAATYTGYSDEDRQKRREALIRTADNMYELVQAVINANPSWRELGDREAARIAFLRIRAAQARELANCYARNGSIGPHPESSQAYRQAVAEFDDNLVAGGSSPGMRMLIYAFAPSGATLVPPAWDYLPLASAAQVAIGTGRPGAPAPSRAVAQEPLRPYAVPGTLPRGLDPAKGFKTFDEFKAAFGAAGKGQAWHHVVKQTINSGRFAPELLHNPANLLRLPHGKGSIHAKISGFYGSKPAWTGGLTVREWLSQKSFKEQFEFGIQTIKQFGGEEYLPTELQ